MYDLANQSFTLLIVTLFYSIYFQNTIASSPEKGKVLWGFAIGISSAIIVAVGPLLGAVADFGGNKKKWLVGLGIGCSTLTMGLALTGPGDVWLALTLFVLANVMFMGGENFLAAFLPEVSTRDTISRVSAIGWTMGYLGAMLVLPVAGVILIAMEQSQAAFRVVFVFAGVWFLVNALPTMLVLREKKLAERLPDGVRIEAIGFVRLRESARQASRYRELIRFLAAFFFYSCGMSTIIAFSGELAYQYLGAGAVFLGFVWLLSLVAGIGSGTSGWIQRRLGHRGLLAGSLVVWIVTSAGAALMPGPGGGAATWPIWLVGIGVGFGLGLTGNASRALVGVFTPSHKTAEFFGLWGLSYKLASVVGPPAYGAMVALAGQSAGMVLVSVFFLVGLAGLRFVSVARGRSAAEEAEEEFAGATGAAQGAAERGAASGV